ncbi:MAG: glycosyltransferase [bacterium]
MEVNIFAILIVYNCKIEESKTLNSLLGNYAKNPKAFKNFKLVMYDNSLIEQKICLSIPFKYQYIHDPKNKGLATAYNYAFNKAIAASYDWLLLLDQDSSLPEDFIDNLIHEISGIEKDNTVAAVVPKLRYKENLFSPSKDLFGGTLRPIDMRHKGICDFKVFATGSGTAVRVSFVQKIGGFDEFYWLDFLDRWLFITINNMGGKVYVTDSIIDHDLSVMNYDKYMNEERYKNILKYETIFMKSFKSGAEKYVYYLRLIKRIVYLFFTVNNKKYSLMTLKHLKNVLLSSKNDKIDITGTNKI